MRERLGSFEVRLGTGERIANEGRAGSDGEPPIEATRYRFGYSEQNDKLIPGIECTLRAGDEEALVTVTAVAKRSLSLESVRALPSSALPEGATLVIYPWFLYERLLSALGQLLQDDSYTTDTALVTFGKRPAMREPADLKYTHDELNESQLAAVRLCVEGNVAFVWGPPGTGKTTTLGHIVSEFAAADLRVLVTSTTNAAVDKALAKLASLPEMKPLLATGEIVRIGRTDEETYGASLAQVLSAVNSGANEQLRQLEWSRQRMATQSERTEEVARRLETDGGDQISLFDEMPSRLGMHDLAEVVPACEVDTFLVLPAGSQLGRIGELGQELAGKLSQTEDQILEIQKGMIRNERQIVRRARVVLATMANTYVNRLLANERFDVVVVEEAGMAVLPAVFYCTSLARTRSILVGDPKQLPPIVQSGDPYVHRAMGRNIFEVFASAGSADSHTVLLNTQYRMHESIGKLVSSLFYDGRVHNDDSTSEREAIAALEPFAGAPLVLVDTSGCGVCETPGGSFSRYNDRTAALCVSLAAQAVEADIQSIAIITPYVEQSRRIGRLLRKRRLSDVECRTVHRFQGNERDLVILDTVDGEPLSPGVLLASGPSAANLINVSISRARGKLLLLADRPYFARRAPQSPIGRLLVAAAEQGKVELAKDILCT